MGMGGVGTLSLLVAGGVEEDLVRSQKDGKQPEINKGLAVLPGISF